MTLRKAFLAMALGTVGAFAAVMPALALEAVPPVRVVEPADPGEHLPSVGRSLFDQLFAVSRGADVEVDPPFPFEALLSRIDAQLQRDPDSPLPPAKRVLIPLGRSLQRSAAAPEYFAYPRVVVAVDSPSATAATPLLKDRLFIGYQEQSAVLEVISYNEAAGRFEFQLVKDYRAGGKPRVVYANRNICFACHQNGAPIFSRALWDETNANPAVAALLLATRERFYGIPPGRGIDVPYAIDNATERANGLALTQRLWRDGCGGKQPAAQRCRAGLFAAALRYALSGGQSWLPDARFEQMVAAPLRREASRRWPGGLAAGNADIPNRNPLQGLVSWPADSAARVAYSDVQARFDPLLPRPQQPVWHADAAGALQPLVAGLAEFVAAADRRQLVKVLDRSAAVGTRRIAVACRIDASPAASRWVLRCAAPAGTLLAGTLSLRAGRPAGGRLTRLMLPGGTALNDLELAPVGQATATAASLQPRADGQLPRTAGGDAVSVIDIERPAGGEQGEATLLIREEFALVQQALERLLAGPEAASLFGPTPLPREKLFAALFAELGSRPPPPCCQAARRLPAPQLAAPAVVAGQSSASASDPLLRAFQPYCAACHQSAETFPPNFLQGSAAEVTARLRHCAPRLYVRLAMADVAPEQRAKTPMPPESMLPAFASDPASWRGSPLRAGLLAQVEQWLRAETGQAPQLAAMLAGGYEALRPCLPPR
ncbi:MAG: hypothetical protein H6942_15840 [Candidatus Accumulibacter sp.]|uniref:hypothetical protein n=1 Tax=Accumulibacter sp. TaxID=2053492 RepID=UPI0025F9D2A0|nr:hypothetical protein [Accumulibacter sp.]MCP5249980.1 hypothetical protein [Accumulibacter sp.]